MAVVLINEIAQGPNCAIQFFSDGSLKLNLTNVASQKFEIQGYQQFDTLSPAPAVAPIGAAALYTDGANLLLSVSGGAYAAVLAGAPPTPTQIVNDGGSVVI